MGGMVPALQNGGRWNHIASDAETKRAVSDVGSRIIEAPAIGMTFILSDTLLTIVRAGALGGDTREVEGGWVYGDFISYLRDCEEIKAVGRAAQ